MSEKCTRCGRSLKKSYLIDGVPYGPICVKRMGGVITPDGVARIPRKPKKEGEQPDFFAIDMAEVEKRVLASLDAVYSGDIVGDEFCSDLDRVIHVVRHGRTPYTLSLEESLEYVNHSPTGFSWGYCGSGPAQLSYAILFDYLNGDADRVRELYHDFKNRVIAGFPQDSSFTLTGRQIESVLSVIDAERLSRL